MMRRMIERRLEELDEQRAALIDAQTRLDAGEPVDNIRDLLDAPPNRDRPQRAERRTRSRINHDQMLGLIRDIDPNGARELEGMRERRPERFSRAMEDRRGRLEEMRDDREENPELFALKSAVMNAEREMFQTVREHINNGGSPDDELRTKVRPLVEQQVSAQAAIKALQADAMQLRLDNARAAIQSQADSPDQQIDERLEQVMQRITKFKERRGKRSGERRRPRDRRED
jgi:ribosome-associated translation inhibitor RaiA